MHLFYNSVLYGLLPNLLKLKVGLPAFILFVQYSTFVFLQHSNYQGLVQVGGGQQARLPPKNLI